VFVAADAAPPAVRWSKSQSSPDGGRANATWSLLGTAVSKWPIVVTRRACSKKLSHSVCWKVLRAARKREQSPTAISVVSSLYSHTACIAMFLRASKNSPHSCIVRSRSTAMRSSGEKVPVDAPSALAPRLPSPSSPSVCDSESTLSCKCDSRGYEKKAEGSVEVVKSCVKSSRLSACDETVRAHSYAHADRKSEPDSAISDTLETIPMRELDLKMGSPSPQCSTAHLIENSPSSSASGTSNASGE